MIPGPVRSRVWRWVALALSGLAFMAASGAMLAAEPGRHVQMQFDDRTLNGWFTEVDEPRATILMLHGTLAHANMEIMATLAEVFAEHGIETLRVTLSLEVDDRHGMFDCETTHRHRHTDAIAELAVWFRWLDEQDREAVVLLGHSRGTNQVAQYAAGPASVSGAPAPVALVLVAPGLRDAGAVSRRYGSRGGESLASLLETANRRVEAGHGDEILGRVPFLHCAEVPVTAESFLSYYADDPDFDTLDLVVRLRRPVIVFAGSEDPLTDGLDAAIAAAPEEAKVEFVMIDGADHFFRDLYAYDLVEAVQEWLEHWEIR